MAVVLAGCGVGVNEDLVATSTPYPIRSPVGASSAPATPEPAAVAALATAQAALAGGSPAAAVPVFGTAIAAAPRDPDGYAGRAAARAASDDLDGAAADLDAAVALAPGRADLYLARAALAERRADFAAAEADYGRAIARSPGDPALYAARAFAILLTAQGNLDRYQAALDDLNRALVLDPAYRPARLGRVRVLADRAMFRGDPTDLDRALSELDALSDAVGDPDVLLLRARVLAARGDVQGARQALAAAEGSMRADRSPVATAPLETARALVALKATDWVAAARAADAALRADPFHWEAYQVLAEAELGRDDARAALRAADRLLARWPDAGAGLYLRGVALAALSREAEARRALEAARTRLPHSPVYQARIAQALQRLG